MSTLGLLHDDCVPAPPPPEHKVVEVILWLVTHLVVCTPTTTYLLVVSIATAGWTIRQDKSPGRFFGNMKEPNMERAQHGEPLQEKHIVAVIPDPGGR